METDGNKPQSQTSGGTPIAPSRIVRFIDDQGARVANVVWRGLKRSPYLGVGLAAGVALGAAALIGPGELVIAIGAGYVAFQILRMDVPPSEAVRRAVEIEKELPA